MADDDAVAGATATVGEQQIINGFNTLAAASRTIAGAATAPAPTEPVWPTAAPDEPRPPRTVPQQPRPPAAPQPTAATASAATAPQPAPATTFTAPPTAPASEKADPADTDQINAAWEVLRDVFAVQMAGINLDIADRARQEIDRGNGRPMGLALRALAAEGRARSRSDDAIGRQLRDADFDAMAGALDALADRMAATTGFALPELVTPATPDQPDPADVAAHRVTAGELLQGLNPRLVRVATTPTVQRPPVDLTTGPVPVAVRPQALRGPRPLREDLHARYEQLQAAPEQPPVGLLMALATAEEILNPAGQDNPATLTAIYAVTADSTPLHTGARLRQLADYIAQRFPAPAAQSAALGTYEQGRTFTDQMRAVSAEIDRIVSNPTALALARAGALFGRIDVDAVTAMLARADQAAARTAERQPRASQTVPNAAAARGAPAPAAAAPSAAPSTSADPGQPTAPAPTAPTAAPAAPAAAADPNRQPSSASSAQGAQQRDPAKAGPPAWYDDPDLLPEHALLGSLVYAPTALDNLSTFLGPREFSDPDLVAVYRALQGLHRKGALFDVASMPNRAQQMDAANENMIKLYEALRASPPPYDAHKISDIAGLLGRINEAAPAESVPFRDVFEASTQMWLGRKVLENHIFRQINQMNVQVERTPVLRPLAATRREERSANVLIANLESIDGQLRAFAGRLAEAVRRTGVVGPAGDPESAPSSATTTTSPGRRWMPDRVRALARPFQHRAELHLIHLALHSARMPEIPNEILTLDPQHFTDPRLANTWRTIQDVQAQGQPVNYVSVNLAKLLGTAHEPMMSGQDLVKLERPPEIKHPKIERALRIVVSSALARVKAERQQAISQIASTPDIPLDRAVGQIRTEVGGLATRAKTTVDHHRQITHLQHAHVRER